METIKAALALARPRGFVRSFVDRGAGMQRLLQELMEAGSGDHYVQGLLSLLDAPSSGGAPEHGVADGRPLSNREIDVLLLAERLSNKEIVGRLCVSPKTVKRHAFNLYDPYPPLPRAVRRR